MAEKEGWNYFEEVRCINLISREDRYNISKKIFKKIGLLNKVDYYQTKKHPNGGVEGCFESHMKVIREAYEKGCENLLVFEDDVSLSDSFNMSNLNKCIQFMKQNQYDIFYLGSFPNIRTHKMVRTKYDQIYKIKGICLHAYVISRQAMRQMLRFKFTGEAIDYLFLNYFHQSYAIYPTMFYQGLHKSDIGYNFWADFGSPSRIKTFYRVREFYAYHINYPVIVFLPIILIIGIWFLFGMNKHYSIEMLLILVGITLVSQLLNY